MLEPPKQPSALGLQCANGDDRSRASDRFSQTTRVAHSMRSVAATAGTQGVRSHRGTSAWRRARGSSGGVACGAKEATVRAAARRKSGMTMISENGSGMRLMECLTLRIKDVDMERSEIRIRRGKGDVDR